MSIFDQFPSRPARKLGWEVLEVDENSGAVRDAFEGSAGFCNPGGNIQGNFIISILDDTLDRTVFVCTGARRIALPFTPTSAFLHLPS